MSPASLEQFPEHVVEANIGFGFSYVLVTRLPNPLHGARYCVPVPRLAHGSHSFAPARDFLPRQFKKRPATDFTAMWH